MKIPYIPKLIIAALAFSLLLPQAHAKEESLKKAKNYENKIPIRVIKKIALPKGYHEDLYYDGRYIWVANGMGIETWLVDPNTGTLVSEVYPIGSFTEGIAAAGKGELWLTDWEDMKLYKVAMDGTNMVKKKEISFAPSHPVGVVRVRDNIYVIIWTRGMGTKYHLLHLDEDGDILRKLRIKRIHEPAHLAWDGKYLWITSWYNRRVYKVDPKTFTIVGHFKSPAKKTTGITWDGQNLWLTGTDVGLFQIEVEK
ncbi:YncE family protein [Candidatus Omnitrophota bacterium]